jgi:selenocysteine-specific elongation factor
MSPGEGAFAQLRLERPVVALPGDRFILRRYSPPVTIGGGIVLHNKPPKLKGRAPGARERFLRLADPNPAVAMHVLVSEAGAAGIDTATLGSRTGLAPDVCDGHLESAVREGDVMALPCKPRKYLSASAHTTLVERVFGALEEFHRREPLREGLPREEVRTRLFHDSHPEVFRCLLADLVSRGKVRMEKDRVALASHQIDLAPREAELLEKMEAVFAGAGTNPPSLQEVINGLGADPGQGQKLFHLLMARGRLVRIPDSRVFHVQAIEDLKRRLWTKRAERPTIDISEFKEMCGTTRRNAIPLLEYLDQLQITRREGNQRVILPPPDSTGPN